VKTGKTQDVI